MCLKKYIFFTNYAKNVVYVVHPVLLLTCHNMVAVMQSSRPRDRRGRGGAQPTQRTAACLSPRWVSLFDQLLGPRWPTEQRTSAEDQLGPRWPTEPQCHSNCLPGWNFMKIILRKVAVMQVIWGKKRSAAFWDNKNILFKCLCNLFITVGLYRTFQGPILNNVLFNTHLFRNWITKLWLLRNGRF